MGVIQHRNEWHNDDASDYSQEDDTRNASPMISAHARSSREKPSGIPRPGGQASRPPVAVDPARSRSQSSSFSTGSCATDESIPPVPQITRNRGRSGPTEITHDLHDTNIDCSHNRPNSSLSRRPSSIARPHSRSYSRSTHLSSEILPIPPLPDSNSDGDSMRDMEQTPKRASWAKDRRRFATATSTATKSSNTNKDSDLLSAEDLGRQFNHPPTPVAGGRQSSLKPPSNFRSSIVPPSVTAPPIPSRIPSTSTKPVGKPPKTRQILENEIDYLNSSHTSSLTEGSVRDRALSVSHGGGKVPQVASRHAFSKMNTSNPSRATSTSRTENIGQPQTTANCFSGRNRTSRDRQSTIHPGRRSDEPSKESEPIVISSRHDTELPISPFNQPDAVVSNHVLQQDNDDPPKSEAISSPVETMLIGSAPTSQPSATPNSKPVLTPARTTNESLVYAPPIHTVSSAEEGGRLSEPSPSKGTPGLSIKAQSPINQEPPSSIFQRFTRRASFSTSKSPKGANAPKIQSTSTPKGRLEVDHNAGESPFDLELETPRPVATIGRGTGTNNATAQHDLSDHQRNRQSSANKSTYCYGSVVQDVRKPRSKVVEEVAGNDADKLGSPFMGDGSPRFGIDERFRSPKKRNKSGLRNHTVVLNDDRSQELLEYYGHGIVEPENAANYFIEGLPIGTVLSSPGNGSTAQTPKGTIPSSPMVLSKKRSQYNYNGRTRPTVGAIPKQEGSKRILEVINTSSDDRTPIAKPRSRSSSSVPPPIITRTSVTSLDSSTRSEFSESSDQESGGRNQLSANHYQEENESSRGSRTPTNVRFAPELTIHESSDSGHKLPAEDLQVHPASHKISPGVNGRLVHRVSQLPIPRQRKTNSALFRALEQPYNSSSSTTVASLDSSPTSGESNSASDAKTSSGYMTTGTSMEGLHTASSIGSSLDGRAVGDIRWSDTQELSGAAAALFHNIERTHSGRSAKPIAEDSEKESLSVNADETNYGFNEESDESNHYWSENSSGLNLDDLQRDSYGKRRMSTQDKRKAIHESWRASLEDIEFKRLEKAYEPTELCRQELIWEFHQSERMFVETMRTLIRLFFQPLRTQDQRKWITGLSPEVTKLFDWLDDIAHLHEQLLDALETMRQDHEQVIILFSETVQPFIPLMELYQPYVVRMDETVKQISAMTLDSSSHFGEFVRMKHALADCEDSLEDMIKRPLSRVREYIHFFQTLLTFTPRTHPDHFSCFSLLHSMDGMMQVLDEVKTREEEYELTKSLLSRVSGLPSQFVAATRENRLLAQGPLTRVHVNKEGCSTGQPASTTRQSGTFVGHQSRNRSGSRSIIGSSSTDSSRRSISSCSTGLRNVSTDYHTHFTSATSSRVNVSRNSLQVSRLTFGARSQIASVHASKSRPKSPGIDCSGETEMYVLVFTNYIILTKRVMVGGLSRSPMQSSDNQWDTLESLGVFRLLGVTDYHGRYGHEYLISLDLAPISDTGLDDIDFPLFVGITSQENKTHDGIQGLQKICQQWFISFQQCYLHTLRSISFPSQSGVATISMDRIEPSISSEIRFPKSPSQQLERTVKRKEARLPPLGNAEEEREEREFWTERFNAISREMKQSYEGISRSTTAEASASKLTESNGIVRFRSSNTFI
ncbi:RhoGEF domain, partial [Rhizoctonia solani]